MFVFPLSNNIKSNLDVTEINRFNKSEGLFGNGEFSKIFILKVSVDFSFLGILLVFEV